MFINNKFEQKLMTEFVSIKEAIENHKGNFKGSCIKASELKAGTGKNGDWTMKKFTLQDPSGQVEIACFNEEINFFKVGEFYEVENAWWKEFTDRNNAKQFSCNVGQYCKVKPINPPTTPTVKEAVEIASEASDNEIPPEPKGPESVNGAEIPSASAYLLGFVDEETIKLLQIREGVRKRMLIHQPRISEVNGAELGGYTLEIYRQMKLEGAKA